MASKLKRPPVIAAIVVGVVVAAGVAKATIPDSGGVIHGCYKQSSGAMRVIDQGAGDACKSSETALDWSQQAPAGPQGSQGPAGPAGGSGPQGPAGLTGATVVTGAAVGDPVIGGFSKTLTCPAGMKVINGTWQWLAWISNDPPAVVQSEPFGDSEWVFAAPAGSATKGLELDIAIECVSAG
jgi:hypothetical protein